jgi:AcrR family transcriptional regulator
LAVAAARPDPLTAFEIARRWFLESRRLEMQELAAELGVNRATLFRWVGSRDQLLAEVIWSVCQPTMAAAATQAKGRGAKRIASFMRHFASEVNSATFFTAFLQREPERALRILTTRAGSFQARVVAGVQVELEKEISAGRMDPPLPVHDLALLIVRIGETFVYTNMITGEPPEAAKVEQATMALLS